MMKIGFSKLISSVLLCGNTNELCNKISAQQNLMVPERGSTDGEASERNQNFGIHIQGRQKPHRRRKKIGSLKALDHHYWLRSSEIKVKSSGKNQSKMIIYCFSFRF
ncbi:Uncharacterized protein Fot_24908 [Forsythia ovata]|uniref:Secreted protein n=1 Tax=Forsythia ovata TaxID=205694 RepID=A0ABD1U8T6_9LAMI